MKYEDKNSAAVCECGSVKFNLLKSGGIECANCQTLIEPMWLPASGHIFDVDESGVSNIYMGCGLIKVGDFKISNDCAGVFVATNPKKLEAGEIEKEDSGRPTDEIGTFIKFVATERKPLEVLRDAVNRAIEHIQ